MEQSPPVRRAHRAPRLKGRRAIASPLVFFMDALLVFLALAGTVLTLSTGYDLAPNVTLFVPLCFLLALVSCVIYALPGVSFIALAVVCQGLAAVVRFQWRTVVRGVEAMVAQIVNITAEKLESNLFMPEPEAMAPAQWTSAVTLALFLVAAVLALYLGWAVVRRRSALWTFLPTFALVLPALLAEQWPWWPVLLALLSCWITQFLCALPNRNSPHAAARLAALCLPVTAALLTALTMLLPQQGYHQPDWALRAYGNLVDLGERLSNSYEQEGLDGLIPSLTAGSTESAGLGGAGPRYSGKTMLEVTATDSRRLYLRGVSLGNYEDGRWTPLSDAQYDTLPVQIDLQNGGQPLYYPALSQYAALAATDTEPVAVSSAVTVRNLRAPSRYLYAPYGLLPGTLANAGFQRDAGVLSKNGQRTHEILFLATTLDRTTGPLPPEAAQAEAAYRAFVYQNYLTVPAGFLDAIGPWREAAVQAGQGLSLPSEDVPAQYEAVLRTARGWAALLGATTQYDLNVTEPPDGQDPLVYFLNESRRGYCMYYASAATLLLRSSGVPARYVSGFVTDVTPGVTQVPDSSAHAWTEIYLDGYGWYPIEVTPPSGVASTAAPLPTVPGDTPEPPTPTPEPDKPDPIPEPDAPADAPPTQPDASGDGGTKSAGSSLWWTMGILLLAAAVAAPPLRRYLARKNRLRRLDPANPNAAALAAYGWLEGLSRFGAETTDAVEELARKAKFSQHTLTREECDVVVSHTWQQAQQVDAALPWHRRLALRYWYGLY